MGAQVLVPRSRENAARTQTMDEAVADLMVLDELRKKSKIMTKSKSQACAEECGCCKPGEEVFQRKVRRAPSDLALIVSQLDGSNHKIENLSPDDLMEDLYRIVSEVLQIHTSNLSLVVGTTILPFFSGQTLRAAGLTSQASVTAIQSKVPYLGYSDAAVADLLKDMDTVIDAADAEFNKKMEELYKKMEELYFGNCCRGRICKCRKLGCWCCPCLCDFFQCGIFQSESEEQDSEEQPSLPDCRLMCKNKASMLKTGRLNKNKPHAKSYSHMDRMDLKTTAKQRRIRFRHDERLCCPSRWDVDRCNELKKCKRQMSKCKRDMHKHKHSWLAFMELEVELEDTWR